MRGIRIHIGLNLYCALSADPYLGRSVGSTSNETRLKPHAEREHGLFGDVAQGKSNLGITACGNRCLMRGDQVGTLLSVPPDDGESQEHRFSRR